MFDQKPQKPLLMPAAERPPESFETRVLRELAAISERLAKLELDSFTKSHAAAIRIALDANLFCSYPASPANPTPPRALD